PRKTPVVTGQVNSDPARSSVAHITKMHTLVSCQGTRSQQRVRFSFGKASRPFGSGHHDAARGREKKVENENKNRNPRSAPAATGCKVQTRRTLNLRARSLVV